MRDAGQIGLGFSALDALPTGVCILGSGHAIAYWNRWLEKWTGLSRESVLGRPLPRVVPLLNDIRYLARLDQVMKGGAPAIFSAQLHGHLFPVVRSRTEVQQQTTVTRFTHDNGDQFLMVAVQDVTEVHQRVREYRRLRDQAIIAEQAAAQANTAKSTFLANMSHEIRTPLTSILGYADLLLDGDIHRLEATEYIQVIRRNGQVLLDSLTGILDLAKVEAGRMNVQLESVDLHELVRGTAEGYRQRAEGLGLQFSVECDVECARMVTDPGHVEAILHQLCDNSVKFTTAGEVSVRVTCDPEAGDRVRINVSDTGPGIPGDPMRLLEPFHQDAVPDGGGMGLGLALANRLAHLLHGSLGIDSHPGIGTTFTLELPTAHPGSVETEALTEKSGASGSEIPDPKVSDPDISNPEKLTAGQSQDGVVDAEPTGGEFATSDKRSRSPGRILVAGDSQAGLVPSALRKAGCTVVGARGGEDLLELFERSQRRSQTFDVIFVDVKMPDMDGHEATRRLRRQGYAGSVVAVLDQAMLGDKQRCFDAGADACVASPLDAGKVLSLVTRLQDADA